MGTGCDGKQKLAVRSFRLVRYGSQQQQQPALPCRTRYVGPCLARTGQTGRYLRGFQTRPARPTCAALRARGRPVCVAGRHASPPCAFEIQPPCTPRKTATTTVALRATTISPPFLSAEQLNGVDSI